MSQNIKKARAQIGAKDIECYMENLKSVVQDVTNTHLWNYDKTNLTDDPGSKKKLVRMDQNMLRKFATTVKAQHS